VKILFVAPYLPSLIRVRPYHLIRELSRRHDISVLATDSARVISEIDSLRQWCRSIDVVAMRPGEAARSCVTAALRGDPLQAAVCQSRQLDHAMRGQLAGRDFDLVHIEHLRAASLVQLVPHGLPTIFDAVDSISLLLRRTLRSSHSVRQRMIAVLELHRTRAFEKQCLERFDRTIVTSSDDRRALLQLAPAAPVTVVPNGVDLDYFKPVPAPHESATLVLSGKMSYHANITAALYFAQTVFPLIRAQVPAVRLRIVGSNPPRSITALGTDPAIDVTGQVPDMRPYVGTATVAVCPVTVKVGIQNKLLEAMAMAVPVVSTSLGVEGTTATPEHDVLVGDSPSGFAAQVVRLLKHPDIAQTIASNGRAYAERHHKWSSAAEQVEQLYESAVAQRTIRGFV
jgi:sugar transferase (PEP-CTERM/EpsH1 system associated)